MVFDMKEELALNLAGVREGMFRYTSRVVAQNSKRIELITDAAQSYQTLVGPGREFEH